MYIFNLVQNLPLIQFLTSEQAIRLVSIILKIHIQLASQLVGCDYHHILSLRIMLLLFYYPPRF
jgi:hypothetical protein